MENEKDYFIKSGFDMMDFDKITDMLKNAFWSIGIKKAEIIQGSKNSALLIGAFIKDTEQIGFARVISDKTRFAYIMDVIVDDKYQRKGIGQAMVNYILNSHELKDVYQWLLITKDAHGVYRKSGFKSVEHPELYMEIRNKRPER